MKIYLTKFSKIFISILALIILAGIGCIIIPLAVEHYRVNAIENVGEFKPTSDMGPPKKIEIDTAINRINDLLKKYPQNLDLKRKLENYEKYSQSMETYRVSEIDDIKEIFSTGDISYHDMSSLRVAFYHKRNEIERTKKKISELIKEYPQNPNLERKLVHYEKYRQSMLATLFPCPEHISSETCDECKGKGGGWLWTCKKCNGKGTVDKNCPNCGAVSPSWIYGKDL